jgi:hypothetical protein
MTVGFAGRQAIETLGDDDAPRDTQRSWNDCVAAIRGPRGMSDGEVAPPVLGQLRRGERRCDQADVARLGDTHAITVAPCLVLEHRCHG